MKKAFFLILLIFLIGCKKETKESSQITVSILPQRYFVKRIAGENVKINVMIPPGASPATYEPSPKQMIDLSNSKIYFKIGYILFEKVWIEKIASVNKNMQIMDTSKGIKLIKEGKNVDPHTWLSPKAVRIQAKNILNTFIKIYPHKKDIYKKNYNDFINDIDNMDKKIENTLKNITKKKFMVFHPAWTYFARDYNLTQLPIEIQGKNPTPYSLKKLIDTAKKEDIRIIFVQSQFDTNNAKAVASEINGNVVQLNPLAEDWPGNMIKIANAFNEVLK